MNLLVRFFIIICAIVFIAPILALAGEALPALFASQAGLSQDLLMRYAGNSILLLLGSVIGAVFFGCFSAYLCSRFEFAGRRLLLLLSVLPLAVPSYLVAYTWVDFLIAQGVHGGALRNLPVTCLIFSLCLAPYVFLPTYGALTQFSASLSESARLLGKGPVRVFFLIELPLVRAAVFTGALLAGMEVLADFGTVDFMAVDTWSTGIYRSWFGYGDRTRAALFSLLLFVFSGTLLFAEARLREKKNLAGRGRSASLVRRRPLPPALWLPCFLLASCPVLLGCLLPSFILLESSLTDATPQLWTSTLAPAATTLMMASSAGIMVLLLGVVFVYTLRLSFGPVWNSIVRLASLGYALPGGVIGIGFLILLAPFSMTGSITGLLLAYCVRFATIGVSTIEAGWSAIPRAYEEQARLLGRSQGGVLHSVSLPLLRKSLACVFILTCIDVIKELPATMLLRPFDFETLSIRTYNLASDERLSETAPSSLLMVVLSLAGILLASRFGAFSLTQTDQNGSTHEK
ncbi:MAG: hypothetical protein RLZZ488_2684 [Pseudomonadota bacterium]